MGQRGACISFTALTSEGAQGAQLKLSADLGAGHGAGTHGSLQSSSPDWSLDGAAERDSLRLTWRPREREGWVFFWSNSRGAAAPASLPGDASRELPGASMRPRLADLMLPGIEVSVVAWSPRQPSAFYGNLRRTSPDEA